jgi:Na+/melibiose symporter-like transporter
VALVIGRWWIAFPEVPMIAYAIALIFRHFDPLTEALMTSIRPDLKARHQPSAP